MGWPNLFLVIQKEKCNFAIANRKNVGMKRKTIILLAVLLLTCVSAMAQRGADELQRIIRWEAGAEVTARTVDTYGVDHCFTAQAISEGIFRRINGKSYRQNPHVALTDLRYLKVLHYDREGKIRLGEMICNKAIAQDLVEIFRELYEHRYPIERMRLIDNYDADDEKSMRANNSSCFCYRTIANSAKISKHARGLAVDINPLYNPYYRRYANGRVVVQPSNATAYCNRSKKFLYKIDKNDLCYKLFVSHGFTWGGAWKSVKDYQHFEK